MKITRFAQSCLRIETKGKRILIDPGYNLYDDSYPRNEWSDIDVLLVTHKHPDHCHLDALREIIKNPKTQFYTTQEVADAYPELNPKIVKAGDVLALGGVTVEVVKAVHGWAQTSKGGIRIHENVGYVVDDGVCRAYQTSDTVAFDHDLKCDVIFLPSVSYGKILDGEMAVFAKKTGARLVIPVHYENQKNPIDFERVKRQVGIALGAQGLNYQFLRIGEGITV